MGRFGIRMELDNLGAPDTRHRQARRNFDNGYEYRAVIWGGSFVARAVGSTAAGRKASPGWLSDRRTSCSGATPVIWKSAVQTKLGPGSDPRPLGAPDSCWHGSYKAPFWKSRRPCVATPRCHDAWHEADSAVASRVAMVSPMRSRLRLTCPCQSRHRIRSIVSARLVPAWRSSAQASGQLLAEVLGFDAAKAAE